MSIDQVNFIIHVGRKKLVWRILRWYRATALGVDEKGAWKLCTMQDTAQQVYVRVDENPTEENNKRLNRIRKTFCMENGVEKRNVTR